MQGLTSDDELDGGTGFDRAIYTDATDGITVDMAAGTVSGDGVDTDTLIGVEGIHGSDFDDFYDATGFAGLSGVPGTPVGANEFEGMAGNDTIIGTLLNGAPNTRISYVSATGAVTVDIALGTATGDASVGTDTFTGVNLVRGSEFGDTLLGGSNLAFTGEVFAGRGGDDFIDGRAGFDLSFYQTATDAIVVNMAAGTVVGDASTGTDTLRSVEGVRGTSFADTYDATGFSGSSTNAGSNGTFNDFEGMGGDDAIAGNGNTRVRFLSATDGVTVDLAAGTATGDASVGNDSFTSVNAVFGSTFADTMSGNALNNNFSGMAGNDYIDGRGGFDTANYISLTFNSGGIDVDLAAGTVVGDALIGTDTLRAVEAAQGTHFADTYDATGFSGSSTNAGSSGTFNQFEGLGGDDVITGNGNTRIGFFSAASGVTVDLGAGTATGDASVGTDTFTGVNSATGSNFDDTISGDSGNNTLLGQIGQRHPRGPRR